MGTARGGPAAVTLPDGRALVIGGQTDSSGTTTNTTELYDPSSGTFSPAAPMGIARLLPAAVVLRSGKVLVVGGSNASDTSDITAEVYDPNANAWTPTAVNMSTRHIQYVQAVRLNDGRVLVVGGNQAPAPSGVDIYDTTTNSFSAGAPMATGRNGPATILLPSGRVLVAGGTDGRNDLASAEIYDPSSNTWAPTANTMFSGRVLPAISPLPGGKVLIAGGVDTTSTATASADIYDPASNSFSPAAPMSTGRVAFGMTALPDGEVLVAGGLTINGMAASYLASAEVYDAPTDAWYPAGSLRQVRAYQGQTLLGNGQVLDAGGVAPGIPVANAELFTPPG